MTIHDHSDAPAVPGAAPHAPAVPGAPSAPGAVPSAGAPSAHPPSGGTRAGAGPAVAVPLPRRLPTGPPPPGPPWEPDTGMKLWLAGVTEHAHEPSAAAVADRVLDARERQRAAAFVRAADRDRYRVAHVALRRLLGGYLGTDPAAVELVREACPGCGGPHGRPAVAGAPLHFSLSHAGDLVLLAFAAVPVGADVEALPSAEVAAEVAQLLHPAEQSELAALPADSVPAAFARCWTRKEAYLKGIGTGLSEDPSVSYVGAGPVPARLADWRLADVPAGPGYAAACAVRAL